MPRIADAFRRRARPRQETDARPPHLTRSQRKRIDAAIARANRSDRKETSAQESIPYERMWPDGICRVAAQYYTKTIQFLDINYQLNQDEDKTAIFEGWGDFLNYFDSSIHFQLSFLNLPVEQEAVTQSLRVTLQGDEFDEIRKELETGRDKPLGAYFKPLAKYIYVPLAGIVFILGIIYKGLG